MAERFGQRRHCPLKEGENQRGDDECRGIYFLLAMTGWGSGEDIKRGMVLHSR